MLPCVLSTKQQSLNQKENSEVLSLLVAINEVPCCPMLPLAEAGLLRHAVCRDWSRRPRCHAGCPLRPVRTLTEAPPQGAGRAPHSPTLPLSHGACSAKSRFSRSTPGLGVSRAPRPHRSFWKVFCLLLWTAWTAQPSLALPPPIPVSGTIYK